MIDPDESDTSELRALFEYLGNQRTHVRDCEQAMADTEARIARVRIRINERNERRAQEGARNGAPAPQVPTPIYPGPNGPSTLAPRDDT